MITCGKDAEVCPVTQITGRAFFPVDGSGLTWGPEIHPRAIESLVPRQSGSRTDGHESLVLPGVQLTHDLKLLHLARAQSAVAHTIWRE